MHMLPRDHCVRNLQLSVKVYIVMSLRNEIMHIHITVSVEQIVSSKQTLKKQSVLEIYPASISYEEATVTLKNYIVYISYTFIMSIFVTSFYCYKHSYK